jgi:hypothetical protein
MTNNFSLDEAIFILHDGVLNEKRFEQSALSNDVFYDERSDLYNQKTHRFSEKKEAEDAINNYKRNPDELNKMGVLFEIADMYYKEIKAKIIYKNEKLSNKIRDVRQDLQLNAMALGINSKDEVIEEVAAMKYSLRAQNFLEKKPVKNIELEIQKLFETYKKHS